MMADAPASDEAVRQRAIDPRLSVVVQAPAGSGKTTLLTQRLLALLGQVSAPERILALTFTRKAAAEMRSRVVGALRHAVLGEPGKLPTRTWDLACKAHRHMMSQGVDLARYPARLRIETIDSFCAWLAGQLPVTGGAGGPIAIAEDASALYREAAERALGTASGDFTAAVDRTLQLNGENWRSARDHIARMLESRNSWLPLLAGRLRAATDLGAQDEREIRRLLDEDLALLIERELKVAAESIGAERLPELHGLLSRAAGRVEPAERVLANWRRSPDALRPEASQAAWWRELAGVLLTSKGKMRSSFDIRVGFPPGSPDKERIRTLAADLDQVAAIVPILDVLRRLPDPGHGDAQWERVRSLARTLILAAAELDTAFRARSSGDFQTVFQAAMRALGSASEPTDLALLLDHCIEHVLIDECQDTSNAQLELFKLLTAGWQPQEGRSFFCVGDPMQSIYGFREAEVRVFLELAEDGLGSLPLEALHLTSNFRAQPPLVDWVNATFSRIFPPHDDRHRGAIAFAPSAACAARKDADAAVQLRLFESPAHEAAFIARQVQAALAQDSRRRIAILVRNKRHAWPIGAALRAHGVQFQSVGIERLQDMPAVRDLLVLSRALLHLEDRIAWLAVLRAPFIGLRLADLAILSRTGTTIWHALNDPLVLAQLSEDGGMRARRCAATLHRAYGARDQSGLARWVERTWMALGGASTGLDTLDQASVRMALDRLDWLEQQGLPDPTQLEETLGDLSPGADTGKNVEIMTIHKAKGLEFDTVFVPALQASPRSGSRDMIQMLTFARTGRPGLALAARAEAGGEQDPLLGFLRDCERAAQRLEAQRLLYVACTRAQAQLQLSACVPEADTAASDGFSPRAGTLLHVLWPGVARQFVRTRVDMAPSPQVPMRLHRLPADWIVPELPAAGALPPPAMPPLSPPFDWAGEAARLTGVLVHRCLQELHCDEHSAGEIRARRADFQRWFAAQGLPPGQIAPAVQRVIEALLAVLADERGRWILGEHPPADARELALSASLDGRILNVVLDRTFIEAGERWVIDYKTSTHGGGELQPFLDSEVQRYSEQMRRYVRIARLMGPEPVRAGLYFPLLRAFREWREP